MGHELARPQSAAMARSQHLIDQFSATPEIADVQAQGARHLAEEQMQALKTAQAISLITQVHAHADTEVSQYLRHADQVSSDLPQGKQEANAAWQQRNQEHLFDNLGTTLEFGDQKIAAAANRSVHEPKQKEPPKKRGWFG